MKNTKVIQECDNLLELLEWALPYIECVLDKTDSNAEDDAMLQRLRCTIKERKERVKP